ncbi:MAG: hypothetical protein KDI14_08175 [Halioglobus sp.]|nr:hypothetical protein [Halioglobus sp.]
MTPRPVPAESTITALAGHQFPGGHYKVEHWENFLLTGCTGAQLLPAGMVHPVALFHVPILGAGTSIAQMFALGQAESDLSIMIESYDWEMFAPLREEVTYAISGAVKSACRCSNQAGQLYDRIEFCFEISDAGVLTARSTITWHYTRNTL